MIFFLAMSLAPRSPRHSSLQPRARHWQRVTADSPSSLAKPTHTHPLRHPWKSYKHTLTYMYSLVAPRARAIMQQWIKEKKKHKNSSAFGLFGIFLFICCGGGPSQEWGFLSFYAVFREDFSQKSRNFSTHLVPHTTLYCAIALLVATIGLRVAASRPLQDRQIPPHSSHFPLSLSSLNPPSFFSYISRFFPLY